MRVFERSRRGDAWREDARIRSERSRRVDEWREDVRIRSERGQSRGWRRRARAAAGIRFRCCREY